MYDVRNYDPAVGRVHPDRRTGPRRLKGQGFGVLNEIDMRETLREKLGKELEGYVILSACNPPLVHQALETDRNIGLLLPCNVVVRADGPGVTPGSGP